jgi:PPOX class probable F420-dependent enzyme
MPAELPPQAIALLDAPSYATLATINPDGAPQTSIVWAARDGNDVLISTIEGRRKTRNMQRDPRVSLLLHDASDTGRYVEVRGTVTLTREGGPELIESLSWAYEGQHFADDEGTDHVRLVVRLTPTRVVTR